MAGTSKTSVFRLYSNDRKNFFSVLCKKKSEKTSKKVVQRVWVRKRNGFIAKLNNCIILKEIRERAPNFVLNKTSKYFRNQIFECSLSKSKMFSIFSYGKTQ